MLALSRGGQRSSRRRWASRWCAKDPYSHRDESLQISKTPPVARQRRSSSFAARLANVEVSLANLAGGVNAAFGRPSCIGAWAHDVTERLERLETLLFSCSFDQFTEIDEMLKVLRKESDLDSMPSFASSSTPLTSPDVAAKGPGATKMSTSCDKGFPSWDKHRGCDTIDEADEARIPVSGMQSQDIEGHFNWELGELDGVGCNDWAGFGSSSSWSECLSASRWGTDLAYIDLSVDSQDPTMGAASWRRPLQEQTSTVCLAPRWDCGIDLGEELSFDELIAASSSMQCNPSLSVSGHDDASPGRESPISRESQTPISR